MITQAELKYWLTYNEATGIFTWLRVSANCVKVGAIAGGLHKGIGYWFTRVGGGRYGNAQLAWLYVYGELPPLEIDHMNRDKADNRISNLRLATRHQNVYNRKVSTATKSGFTGVTWYAPGRSWLVRVSANGVRKCFGYFKDLELACLVAVEARSKLQGEFAIN